MTDFLKSPFRGVRIFKEWVGVRINHESYAFQMTAFIFHEES